jgi:hypothetical protein
MLTNYLLGVSYIIGEYITVHTIMNGHILNVFFLSSKIKNSFCKDIYNTFNHISSFVSDFSHSKF